MDEDELNSELKIKLPPRYNRIDAEFLKAVSDRCLGSVGKKNPTLGFNLQACAEDELVKKQFKEMRCEMPGQPRSTFLMVFSPDGTKVASTHGNHQIYVSDVRTGKHIKTLIGHPRTPWCIAFHPTSNQIIASGCLGGQVRIWDLSGGSEMWNVEGQSVIASIAFHPDYRMLVIATYNLLYFWDWSKPEPFMHVATSTAKEKVRYVAFDKLGHKLITGITNTPQTRWERVRAPVPVPRPADRSNCPYRRRITPRLVTTLPSVPTPSAPSTNVGTSSSGAQCLSRPGTSREREPLSSVPERERRIGTCYKDLVHQYELLVHRYLQVCRPPVMIDQGTDPMEPNASTSTQPPRPPSPVPSTSGVQVLKKSSLKQPAKNKQRLLLPPDSDSSATDPTSPEIPNTLITNTSLSSALDSVLTNLTSGQTSKTNEQNSKDQTNAVDEIKASLSSTSSQAGPSNVDVRIRIQNENQEASEDVRKYLNLTRKKTERLAPNVTRLTMTRKFLLPQNMEQSRNGEHPAQIIDRVQNVEAAGNVDGVDRLQSNEQTENVPERPQTPLPPRSPPEPVYKMRIKCLVKPKIEEAASACARTSSSNEPNENISDLIRNAEMVLAKFRENLERRRNNDIDLPSSSTRLLPQTNDKTSKGTNTTEDYPPTHLRDNLRKRPYPSYSKKRRPVWDSSDSSSDDDDGNKRVRSAEIAENDVSDVNEHTYAVRDIDTPGSSRDHDYINSSLGPNEHSYAGLTEGTSSDNTVRIKINLSSIPPNEFSSSISQLVSSTTGTINTTPVSTTPVSTTPLNTPTIPGLVTPTQPSERRPLNFNAELELLVTDLLSNNETAPANPTTTISTENQTNTAPASDTTQTERLCGSCGGSLEERTHRTSSIPGCARTTSCTRNLATTNQPATPPEQPRRFFSHRLSAFYPTRLIINNPLVRTRLGGSMNYPPLLNSNFAPDEVINYSERVNEEEALRGFHPFDPPPELMSINPENIGIGNMYSNIVQELESSLNDVRNIRANRRLGETSDMLSSFSERLESIMSQSNAILRNLRSSLDSLPPSERLYTRNEEPLYDLLNSPVDLRRNVFASNNPITSDHTYPLNPENPGGNMSPLISLHFTVSHIQRQARLLRQQVESIERIDRAMLEVAQLQMMRQMFDELHRHFSSLGNDRGLGVSSVRQMMAGTRISDSSPYDSPTDEASQTTTSAEPQPSTSASAETQTSNPRGRGRKTYPRCLFLMHRQFRRNVNGVGRRRFCGTDRLRRNMVRRFMPSRTNNRPNIELNSRRNYINLFNPDTLPSMTRRLEHFLMEHGRYIGRSMVLPNNGTNTFSDFAEHVMMLRLTSCRQRMNRVLGINDDSNRNDNASVTIDGSSRYGARQTLGSILDMLSRSMEMNSNVPVSGTVRSQIWEVIELSLLLSEILLLQIVDSIPPPSGMNLDPERGSLTMRIDQMCSRMLQSRQSGQSHQLTRSLRLLRLTVRHATQALGQTYTARRNAMLPDGETLDSRQGLVDDIYNCLRNIRRHRESSMGSPSGGEWYRTINDLITRSTTNQENSTNAETGEVGESNEQPNRVEVEETNSSDENVSNPPSSSSRERPIRPLYRTNNINLLYNEENNSSSTWNHIRNVPAVHVNDVPVTEPTWNSRFAFNRQRLSERLDELRSTAGFFRPRFLHPMFAGNNPFDGDVDESREQIYDSDIIANVTPNHRIQVWEFSKGRIPNINNASINIVVNECKIHNDASVDYASDGSILVTLLPSGGYMNITNRLGVYSLEWETLGQILYVTSFEQNAVSVALSPLNRHLVVGLASRRMSIMPSEKWTMARIFLLDEKEPPYGKLSPIRELEQTRDTTYMSVNCIRWLPTSGQGLVFATNTGHLRFLT